MESFAFLKAAREKMQQSTFGFIPSRDEESTFNNFQHMTMLDFLELGEAPRPAPVPIGPRTVKPLAIKPSFVQPATDETSSVLLHHPRPRRIPAHIDALARFEEMAQTMDCAEFVANGKEVKKPIREPVFRRLTEEEAAARRAKWASFDVAEVNLRHKRERVFFPPEEKPQARPVTERAREGLACISPSFLDNFPEYAERQARWGHGPRPEDLPRPSFVLTGATIRKVVPPTSPTPPLPFQNKVVNAVQESCAGGPLDYYEDDYPSNSWSEHSSDFDDVEQYGEGFSHNHPILSDEQSTAFEDEDDEYRTASEYSGYSADEDTLGAEDGSVYAPSRRTSPNPFVLPSLYSSTGSLTYSLSPSLTDSVLSFYSASSEEVERELSPPADSTRSDVISDDAARILEPICQTMRRLAIQVEV